MIACFAAARGNLDVLHRLDIKPHTFDALLHLDQTRSHIRRLVGALALGCEGYDKMGGVERRILPADPQHADDMGDRRISPESMANFIFQPPHFGKRSVGRSLQNHADKAGILLW